MTDRGGGGHATHREEQKTAIYLPSATTTGAASRDRLSLHNHIALQSCHPDTSG